MPPGDEIDVCGDGSPQYSGSSGGDSVRVDNSPLEVVTSPPRLGAGSSGGMCLGSRASSVEENPLPSALSSASSLESDNSEVQDLSFLNTSEHPVSHKTKNTSSSPIATKKDEAMNMVKPPVEVRYCKVCDSPNAAGHYFGVLSCIPCKAFFIRCLTELENGVPMQCVAASLPDQCVISLDTRTICKSCRYQKCIHQGMARKERPTCVSNQEGRQLCAVCGDIANGVHFGAVTCEGCKKFFRRGLNEAHNYVCRHSCKCVLNPRTRNSCRFCRWEKCVLVGMSRTAIRMGRPSKFAQQLSAAKKTKTKSTELPPCEQSTEPVTSPQDISTVSEQQNTSSSTPTKSKSSKRIGDKERGITDDDTLLDVDSIKKEIIVDSPDSSTDLSGKFQGEIIKFKNNADNVRGGGGGGGDGDGGGGWIRPTSPSGSDSWGPEPPEHHFLAGERSPQGTDSLREFQTVNRVSLKDMLLKEGGGGQMGRRPEIIGGDNGSADHVKNPDPLRHKKPSGTSKPQSVDKLSQQKQQQWQNKSSNSSSEVRGAENEATSTVANSYRSSAVVTNHNSVSSSTSDDNMVGGPYQDLWQPEVKAIKLGPSGPVHGSDTSSDTIESEGDTLPLKQEQPGLLPNSTLDFDDLFFNIDLTTEQQLQIKTECESPVQWLEPESLAATADHTPTSHLSTTPGFPLSRNVSVTSTATSTFNTVTTPAQNTAVQNNSTMKYNPLYVDTNRHAHHSPPDLTSSTEAYGQRMQSGGGTGSYPPDTYARPMFRGNLQEGNKHPMVGLSKGIPDVTSMDPSQCGPLAAMADMAFNREQLKQKHFPGGNYSEHFNPHMRGFDNISHLNPNPQQQHPPSSTPHNLHHPNPPWPSPASSATNVYPGPPPFNFRSPASSALGGLMPPNLRHPSPMAPLQNPFSAFPTAYSAGSGRSESRTSPQKAQQQHQHHHQPQQPQSTSPATVSADNPFSFPAPSPPRSGGSGGSRMKSDGHHPYHSLSPTRPAGTSTDAWKKGGEPSKPRGLTPASAIHTFTGQGGDRVGEGTSQQAATSSTPSGNQFNFKSGPSTSSGAGSSNSLSPRGGAAGIGGGVGSVEGKTENMMDKIKASFMNTVVTKEMPFKINRTSPRMKARPSGEGDGSMRPGGPPSLPSPHGRAGEAEEAGDGEVPENPRWQNVESAKFTSGNLPPWEPPAIDYDYWLSPELPNPDIFLSDAHNEMIQTILSAYKDYLDDMEGILYYLKFETEKFLKKYGNMVPPLEILRKELALFAQSTVSFCCRIPEFSSLPQDDQIILFRVGGNQFRVLTSAFHWYDKEAREYTIFYPLKPHPGRMDYNFYIKGKALCQRVRETLEPDLIEESLLIVVLLYSTDYNGLSNDGQICKARWKVLECFRAYTTAKYGSSNQQIENLFSVIPQLRELGCIEHKLGQNLSLLKDETYPIPDPCSVKQDFPLPDLVHDAIIPPGSGSASGS